MIRINNNPLQTIMQRITNEWDRLGTLVSIQSPHLHKKGFNDYTNQNVCRITK